MVTPVVSFVATRIELQLYLIMSSSEMLRKKEIVILFFLGLCTVSHLCLHFLLVSIIGYVLWL